MDAALTHWLRLLWDTAPTLHVTREGPYIAQGGIHLPVGGHWRQSMAAAAHAAAHLVYSPKHFDGRGLTPTARILVALLEDARVESLAMRELPGLARLWRPLHTATPDLGSGFEALMQRLARALVDPGYEDPDPWVHKGRELFYLDRGLGLPALCTPQALRVAASRLGHDIGQMRLTFNARTHRAAPAYRDDHRWMWPAEVPQEPPGVAAPAPAREDAAVALSSTTHPEWDRLIQRLRPRWCQVLEMPAQVGGTAEVDDEVAAAAVALQRPLSRLNQVHGGWRRSGDGVRFDLDAWIAWRTAGRHTGGADPRWSCEPRRSRSAAAVWILVDQSASSCEALDAGAGSVVHAACRGALAWALALQRLGVVTAIYGFHSNGRHAVRLETVKAAQERITPGVMACLAQRRPGGSTRLGAVLRHATGRLAARREPVRWIVLFSDGQPHDVDVHDPRYLVEDARHAVRQAQRRGVRTACVVLAPGVDGDVRQIFGAEGARALRDLPALPVVARQLLK